MYSGFHTGPLGPGAGIPVRRVDRRRILRKFSGMSFNASIFTPLGS